jgi:hypothetical protein
MFTLSEVKLNSLMRGPLGGDKSRRPDIVFMRLSRGRLFFDAMGGGGMKDWRFFGGFFFLEEPALNGFLTVIEPGPE